MAESTPEPPGRAPARASPYELVFAGEEFESRVFPRIAEDAAGHGLDPLYAEQFVMVPEAARAVRDVVPEGAPPEALEQYRSLLYHAFNFWRFGRRLYLVEQAVARFVVEAAPGEGEEEPALPHPSVYFQLPANLFWSSISPEATPEPVDGFFATASEGRDPLGAPYLQLDVLFVLGVRRDRAGFSVIPLRTEVGQGITAPWEEAPGRESGGDFENVLPGGEIRGLYSLLTVAEALKLAGRIMLYVARYPGDVVQEEADEPPAGRPQAGPPASRLPYARVTLGGGDEAS